MGFPLRSNIFKSGTSEQRYFASFPIQVAVLFSPTNREFADAFKEIFLELDRLTGDDVLFFAVLDPPQDWQNVAQYRPVWRTYQQQLGQVGFSFDDRVLVLEMARLFGISWSSLPAIVVGNNLWAGEFISSPTDQWHIQRQLQILTNLAREWGQPNIGHIDQALRESIGFETTYHPPNDALRYRLNRVYGVLDTAAHGFDLERYQRSIQLELREVESALNRVRRYGRDFIPQQNEGILLQNNEAFDDIVEDARGKLVAPATVAMRVSERLRAAPDYSMMEHLEEESFVMVETALRVGTLLEHMKENTWEGTSTFRLPRPGKSRYYPDAQNVDFTPGAQGAWKAFELEVNFSFIQAARASRAVKMPEFFARYDANLPKVKSKVQTGTRRGGRPITKDINQLDEKNKPSARHRFLTLGEALFVTEAMRTSPIESFNDIVSQCLQGAVDSSIFDAWKRIYRMRNQASHIRALNYSDYSSVLSDALSPELLLPLMKIKKALSNH
jgi:hypothetical protein